MFLMNLKKKINKISKLSNNDNFNSHLKDLIKEKIKSGKVIDIDFVDDKGNYKYVKESRNIPDNKQIPKLIKNHTAKKYGVKN